MSVWCLIYRYQFSVQGWQKMVRPYLDASNAEIGVVNTRSKEGSGPFQDAR